MTNPRLRLVLRGFSAHFRRIALVGFACSLAASAAYSRPAYRDTHPRYVYDDLSAPPSRTAGSIQAPSATAVQDTVYFGGTTWNPVTSRWEALRDSVWTFDTGVGSSYDHTAPGVSQFKDPSLHALMEGWVGIDLDYIPLQRFQRTHFGTGPNNCNLGGNWGLYCGLPSAAADSACYVAGQGYGNNWNICAEHTFNYSGAGTVSVVYDYENDTELDFDFTYVYVDTTGYGDTLQVAVYNSAIGGTENLVLSPGFGLPHQAGPITLKFCVVSDEAYSDEDGDYTTKCGAFLVDNISVTGGGISYATDFETDDGGWTATPPLAGPGSDWSNIVHLRDLPPPMVGCACNLQDSVLVFEDYTVGGHNLYQNNIAASPWIDLQAAGLTGAPNKFIEADMYVDLPLLNYLYTQFFVQWYPYVCPSSGLTITSPWVIDGKTHYYGTPQCTVPGGPPFRSDFSALMDVGAQQVRIGVGIFSACLFFPNCTGISNSSPWFDNVKFGVAGTFGGSAAAPVLVAPETGLPQDAFPEDGTLHLTSTGRVDSGIITSGTEPGPDTALGDTLTVQGGSGGAEVWVQFSVRPGPGTDPVGLSDFLSRVTFQETKRGMDWYAARMDTAEVGGVVSPGTWMTTFHEDDPGFTGSDTDIDMGDPGPSGNTRLANDIFPDHLFTAGTRLNLFYKTKFTAGSTWYTLPDTTGGQALEMEILPSSMDSTGSFNCVLLVDHYDRGTAQDLIEQGLGTVISGGSSNAENTAWDRFDVRAASSHQATFGRPNGADYGASLNQALAYRAILWNSGSFSAVNLVDEDANILRAWLQVLDPSGNGLYLAGDNIASSMTAEAGTDPMAYDLLNGLLGVNLTCDAFRDAGCPGGSPMDSTVCVNIDPVTGAVVSLRPRGKTHLGKGNGCPTNRSFDILGVNPGAVYGAPQGEEEYATGIKTAQFASVSNQASGVISYKSLVDGIALNNRQEPGYCYNQSESSGSIGERLEEVLTWFGYTGSLPGCNDPGTPTAVGDGPGAGFRTDLTRFSPNPLPAGQARGRILFTLAEDGPARISIFDLQGRLVRTVWDGPAAKGPNTAFWDGTDKTGRAVASGVYFYALRTGGKELSKKMVVVR